MVEVLIGVATAPGPTPTTQDVVRAQLDAGLTGQHAHPALGQAVGGVAGHRPVLVHRGDVDDPAPAALGDHLLGGQLGAEEGALQVDLHDLFVLGLGRVQHRGAGLDAGVVDHDVEAAHFLHRLVDEHLQVGDLAHVGLDPDGLVPEGGDLPLQFLGGLLVGHVVDHDVGPGAGQGEHDGLADPGIATGHDGDLSFERHRPLLFFSGRLLLLAQLPRYHGGTALSARTINRLTSPYGHPMWGISRGRAEAVPTPALAYHDLVVSS